MGDEIRGGILKDSSEVRSLIESLSGLDQNLMFEL